MMNSRVGSYVLPISAILFLAYHYRDVLRGRRIRHPPSPTSYPLVGNLFSIPSGHEYIAFAKLGEQLKSDIVYLELLGQKIIVLNSAEIVSEIMEKRSALYSDRPPIPMVTDPTLMNWSSLPTMTGYNDLWRHYRRILNNWLNARAVTQFDDLQERQARLLLRRLLGATDQAQAFERVRNEFYFTMASTMFQLAYGYELENSQDHFLKEAEVAMYNILSAGMQTNFFVNIFPALSRVPDWLPGTGWKRTAREWGTQQAKAKAGPYEWVKARVWGAPAFDNQLSTPRSHLTIGIEYYGEGGTSERSWIHNVWRLVHHVVGQ
ncbi:unnamed protein product [Rhizoctonia solani]|uniref:O-methylsterigmatocystin oxidoreductase n=1 Tax=Rhizoctonia solani TaxID=456999 RepID=A0A8H3EBN5_9AGAM|nr:unnamed protein product [Rhizoctonia solani]